MMTPFVQRNLFGAIGACLGMAAVGFGTRVLAGADPADLWLVAPMGASALLIFALPASPLAQPWPVIGGHLVSAAIGLALYLTGLAPPLAVALAVGLATGAMMLARCVHPPAGGTAALTAMAAPAIAKAGWWFLVMPLGVNLALLVATGLVWHRLTGHSYPHRVQPSPDAVPINQIEAVLAQWADTIDVAPADLALLSEAIAAKARAGGT